MSGPARGPAPGVLAAGAALTAGALALRTAGLGRLPLWLDEGFSHLQVTHRPLADWRLDVHPPLYYAVLWAWAQVSTSDVWLRALSALTGAATHEMLLPRYDATGRLAGLPRVATHRAEQDCAGAVAPCLDAALQAAGAVPGTRIWVIRRIRELPPPLASWAQRRLEPEVTEQFRRITVEPVRVRP